MMRYSFTICLLLGSGLLFSTDQESSISLFVVGCCTPEFQETYDDDLDGYLLIGSESDIDGAYLPRNYDNDIPGQNCDLPIRRSKMAPFNAVKGTFVEARLLVDNSSTVGGGPFDAAFTVAVLDFPEGLVPYSSSNPVRINGQRLECDLGTVNANSQKGVSVRFLAQESGEYTISGTVSSSLFDPDPSNNSSSFTFQVVEPGTYLVYPWISKNEQFASDVVINNYGGDEALVWLSAVRAEGEFHFRAVVIPARGFIRETTQSLFPAIEDGPGYSIRLLSESNRIRGRWVTNNLFAASGSSPSQGVAVNMLDPSMTKSRAGRDILFGYLPISEDLISAPVVVNMGVEETAIQLDFFDRSGQLVFSDSQVLESQQPYRPFATVANNLVPMGTGDVYMRGSSENNLLTGVGFVFNTSAEPAIGNVSSVSSLAGSRRKLMLPWISNNNQFESIIVVNNLSDTETTVQLKAQRFSDPSESISRTIPANGFLAENASTLFQALGQGGGYSVLVTSSSGNIAGSWVTNNLTTASGSSPSQGVGIHLEQGQSSRYGQHILFGYLPLSNGFTSAPVIVNIGDGPTQVTMRFYDLAGHLVSEDTSTLAALEALRPFATVANNLVPSNSGDVYMVASSAEQPITGVAFVFNSGSEPAIGNVSRIDFEP